MKFLLSPTDSDLGELLGDDAITSSVPEQKGADVLIFSKAGLYGAQRKTVPHDFIASISDGRLVRETTLLMQHCKFRELICEGRFRYWPDGHLAVDRKSPSKYTRRQIRGILFDVKYIKGIVVEYTDDLADTANYLRWMYNLLNEEKHFGLYRRPSVQGAWQVPTNADIQSWVLQSWPGIGPSTADAIIKHFGRIPLRWSCTIDELASIPRLSQAKAREMVQSLEAEAPTTVETSTKAARSDFDVLREKLRYGLRLQQ